MIRLPAIFRLLPMLALGSCVPPKAIIVENARETGKKEPAEELADTPVPQELPDDGIRLPDERMLTMPGDGDFRSPALPLPLGPTGSGAVTVRPPTDPPPRPKPSEADNP